MNGDKKHQSRVRLFDTLVVIVVVAIIACVLFPALVSPRIHGPHGGSQSKHNLFQLGKAIKLYEGYGNGNLSTDQWQEKLLPFLEYEESVFVDPSDKNGAPSYALSSEVATMGVDDVDKIAIIESDHETILIDSKDCNNGRPNIKGTFASRYYDMTRALMYSGAVRTFEPAAIDLHNASYVPLAMWWLAHDKRNIVCGKTIQVADREQLGD